MLIAKFIYVGLFLLVVSCTISKPIIPNNISENKRQRLEANKKRKAIQSDLDIMKGWTEAEKQYFIDNFVYKRIEIRNDTLVFIKWAGWTTQFVLYPNTWDSKMIGVEINYWRNRIGKVFNMKL